MRWIVKKKLYKCGYVVWAFEQDVIYQRLKLNRSVKRFKDWYEEWVKTEK